MLRFTSLEISCPQHLGSEQKKIKRIRKEKTKDLHCHADLINIPGIKVNSVTCIARGNTFLYLQFHPFQGCQQQAADDWKELCASRVSRLRQMADKVDRIQFDTNIATTVGSSVGLLGGAASLFGLGLVLAPITAGASLTLALAVGGGVAASAGAATSIGSLITRGTVNRKMRKELIKILESDKREMKQMQTMAEVLVEMYNSCMEVYDSIVGNKLYKTTNITKHGFQRVVDHLRILQRQLDDIQRAIWPDESDFSLERELNILKTESIERARSIVSLFKTTKQIISELENVRMNEESNFRNYTRKVVRNNQDVPNPETKSAAARLASTGITRAGAVAADTTRLGVIGATKTVSAVTETASVGVKEMSKSIGFFMKYTAQGTTKSVTAGLQVHVTPLKDVIY